MISGCIERYFPDDEEVQVGTLVVSAHLTDQPGLQTISVSRSTTLEFPSFDPVTDCQVELEQDDGTFIVFGEGKPGIYEGIFDESQLITGHAYRLHIITPGGKRYESSYEILHPATGIDSLYYKTEMRPAKDPAVTEEGIRFYLDFEIDRDSGRYLRWQLIETWEMHNPDYTSTRMYDTDRRTKEIPDSIANRICWITQEIPEVHTRDLGGISGTRYRALPLNYVSTETQRLHHRYSLLVRQYSLDANAFWYWDELGKNTQSKGTLFDTQPSLTPSNICNVEDEEELVIGYFSISGITERRIVVGEVPGLTIREDPFFCEPGALPISFGRLSPDFLPYFMATKTVNGREEYGGVPRECIDCREYKGSTNVPPEYW
ncbi:MAG: DUF4249 domain-containing protein [Bacteroidales bacterium]